jgi:hypothetical protein
VLGKGPEPLGFSETVGVRPGVRRGLRSDPGGRPGLVLDGGFGSGSGRGLPPDTLAGLAEPEDDRPRGAGTRLEPLVREWLMDLQVLGRSPRTIRWYQQKIGGYLRSGGVETLEQLTAFEFKRYLADLQGRGLAPNTVHGCFETLKAFANWVARESYPVDPGVLRARAPKVPQQEMETYSEAQIEALLRAAPEGWSRMAILTLLGTGMRPSEARRARPCSRGASSRPASPYSCWRSRGALPSSSCSVGEPCRRPLPSVA